LGEWSARGEQTLPKFKFIVALGRHQTGEDMTGFEREFNECDIFLPEAQGWSKGQLQVVRGVARGEIEPEEALEKMADEHLWAEMRMLYNSGKAVGYIDVGRDVSLLDDEIRTLSEEAVRREKVAGRKSFADRMDDARYYLKGTAEILVKRREAYILRQIEPTLKEVLKAYPHLRSKPELVLLENEVSKLPDISYLAELNDQAIVAQLRKLVDNYSLEEIKTIFDRVNQNGKGFRQVLDESLKLKGLKLPDIAVTRVRR